MTTVQEHLTYIRDARMRALALYQSIVSRMLQTRTAGECDLELDRAQLDVELARIALAEAEIELVNHKETGP